MHKYCMFLSFNQAQGLSGAEKFQKLYKKLHCDK